VSILGGSSFVPTKATSTALTATKIDRAKIKYTIGNPSNGSVTAYLSNDDGTTWDEAENNHMTVLTGTPTTSGLIFKFEFVPTADPKIYVEDVIIDNGREFNKTPVTEMIVDAGLNLIKDLVSGDSTDNPSYGAVGADDTAPYASETTLVDEKVRKAITDYSSGNEETTFQVWIASTEGNGEDLEEVGLFNDVAAGDMVGRATFDTVTKTDVKEILIDYKVVYTDES